VGDPLPSGSFGEAKSRPENPFRRPLKSPSFKRDRHHGPPVIPLVSEHRGEIAAIRRPVDLLDGVALLPPTLALDSMAERAGALSLFLSLIPLPVTLSFPPFVLLAEALSLTPFTFV
jgi:hypothetical protein